MSNLNFVCVSCCQLYGESVEEVTEVRAFVLDIGLVTRFCALIFNVIRNAPTQTAEEGTGIGQM